MENNSKNMIDLAESGAAAAEDSGIFGTSIAFAEASLVLYPVAWEATTSYGGGTSEGPEVILTASRQLDLEDPCFDRPYRPGLFLSQGRETLFGMNQAASLLVEDLRVSPNAEEKARDEKIARVNALSAGVNTIVYEDTAKLAQQHKFIGVIGGDHSSPYGFIKHLSEVHDQFGILHFDAHLDLRDSFEGFKHSHASIMHNVINDFPQVVKLVSVGIRDYSFHEKEFCHAHQKRIRVFTDRDTFRRKQQGVLYSQICKEILSELPGKVYISFDIDGLDQRFCPSTGTPVPGGVEFNEACYLIEELALSAKKIIGFDLCEVARSADSSEWDGNVAARILYKICGALLFSQGKIGLASAF